MINFREVFLKDWGRFDTQLQRWEGKPKPLPFEGRAHHSATLVGNEIWVLGGSSKTVAFADVNVLNIDTLHWRNVRVK